MSRQAAIALLTVTLGCSGQVGYQTAPKVAGSQGESLLIELVVRDAWMGDNRYLASYDAMAPRGALKISGRKRGGRSLSLAKIRQLVGLVETKLLEATSVPATCEDCVEYYLLVRLGDRSHFAILHETGSGPPPEVSELLSALGERNAS